MDRVDLGPDGEKIEVKQSLKDLGVHLSSDLTLKLQVEKTVTSASKMAQNFQEEKSWYFENYLEDPSPTKTGLL